MPPALVTEKSIEVIGEKMALRPTSAQHFMIVVADDVVEILSLAPYWITQWSNL
jgi:hypothetical protein